MEARKETLVVVAGIEFDRSYAGTQYLLERLNETFAVVLYVHANARRCRWYEQLPFTCHILPYRDSTWRNWHVRLTYRIFSLGVRLRMLFARRVLITETAYLREAAWAKRIRGRRMALAQFCQELCFPEEYPADRWPAIQKRWARVPDVVIDVDPSRAAIRAEYFHLDRMPYVLRNTFPLAQLPPPAPPGALWALAQVPPPPAGVPVLVHAGGVGREKPLERIIDAVAETGRPLFLLAFCAASEADIRRLRDYAANRLRPGQFALVPAVSREQLRASLWEADIGAIDYSFSVEPTANQKHCAPTKLYEFMACGLAVLGSNNDSLRNVIEREGIGCCAAGDAPRDLAQALERLLDSGVEEMKRKARAVFAEKYSFEVACEGEVRKIAAELQGPGRPVGASA